MFDEQLITPLEDTELSSIVTGESTEDMTGSLREAAWNLSQCAVPILKASVPIKDKLEARDVRRERHDAQAVPEGRDEKRDGKEAMKEKRSRRDIRSPREIETVANNHNNNPVRRKWPESITGVINHDELRRLALPKPEPEP